MEKIVIVSTNNNPDYYFYAPYIKKAWNKLGWKVAVMCTEGVPAIDCDIRIDLPYTNLRPETIAQAGRLYAANYLDGLLMTSDMDLLPLKDYWNPNPNEITNYGHDLTGYSFYPMGYTAMSSENWKRVMNLTSNTEADMIRDANDPTIKHSPLSGEWEQWWNYDWSLLTERLKHHNVTKVLRGNRAGSSFAYGRIDRGDSMQTPPCKDLIDAHCENHNVQHPDKLKRFMEIFNKYYGEI